MASRLSSLLISAPRASASSLSQLDRQLRQKPARFIRSMFRTSLRERRCSTSRRKAAASSSVLVLSSIAMSVVSSFCVSLLILGGCCHSCRQRHSNPLFRHHFLRGPHPGK